jgi:cysteine-rich repeat protein
MARTLLLYGYLTLALAACGFGDNRVVGATTQRCGDTIVDGNEGCDDGNRVDGDGCSKDCAVEVSDPVCGNGVREVGEACDDGNGASADGCSSTCTVESVCGNGTREAGEACDDGNVASGDGCSSVCQVETSTACGVIPQTGCSASQACDFIDSAGTTGCRAITTSGTADSTCTTDTQCAAGFTCVTAQSSETISICMQFCNTDAQCGAGARCVFDLTTSNGTPLNVSVCSNACDVLTQTGCATGLSCMPFSDQDGDITNCEEMDGTVLDGQTCVSSNDCLPASACVSTSGGTKRCRELCDVDNPTCSAGLSCDAFSSPLEVNGLELGSCR